MRVQLPFAASDDSEPEPDLVLVPPRRYADRHPRQAYLLIEVADSSLDHDRETKAPLYASSGVPEYWIVDPETKDSFGYLLENGKYDEPLTLNSKINIRVLDK